MSRPLPEFLNVPWRPRNAITVFVASWLLVPVLVAIGLRWAASYSPMVQGWLAAFADGDITASFIFSLTTSVLALGVVFYYLRKYGANWKSLGLRPFNVSKALVYIAGTAILFLLSIPVLFIVLQTLVPGFNADQAQTNDFTAPTTAAGLQLSFLALVVLPPVVEELIFRGFIFPAFAKRWGLVAGAVITSLLFGFAHLQANVGVYTIVLSLILCLMYARLGSVVPGIALHMLNNYLAFISKVQQ